MKKSLAVISILMILSGIVMIGGGSWGLAFTYEHVAREHITTPDDASIPGVPVRGPLTLKVQADTIRMHVLHTTGDKTFAEMPRQIPQVDAAGNQVLDAEGKPVMVANTTRDMWVTATTLITALNLGMFAYGFCLFAIAVGVLFLINGIALRVLGKQEK